MPNREHIATLIAVINAAEYMSYDDIEQAIAHGDDLPSHGVFNMTNYETDCGTPMCIAGWCYKLQSSTGILGHTARVADYLGITNDEAETLTLPPHMLKDDGGEFHRLWNDITPAEAIFVLNQLANGQPVDWQAAYDQVNANSCADDPDLPTEGIHP